MSGNSIHIANFHSWDAFQRIAADAEAEGRYYGQIQHWMEASEVAWLVECLKVMEDNEDRFPYGKWATIQALQEALYKAAKDAVIGVIEK